MIGNYTLALETFHYNYENFTESPSSASILYLSYIINNQTKEAEDLKNNIESDEKSLADFERYLKEDIRKINLTVGIPNEAFLKLVLNDENLYLNQSLLRNTYSCINCQIKMITENIIDIGEAILKKRFCLESNIESPCIAVEIECPMKFRDSIENILYSLNFDQKRNIEIPVLRKKGDPRPTTTKTNIYIRKKNDSLSGIIICDLDLDGELNNNYFTIWVRK